MLCVVGKKGALEDHPPLDTQPVKPVLHEITNIVKVFIAVDAATLSTDCKLSVTFVGAPYKRLLQ